MNDVWWYVISFIVFWGLSVYAAMTVPYLTRRERLFWIAMFFLVYPVLIIVFILLASVGGGQ